MNIKTIKKQYHFNTDYILSNIMPPKKLAEANISLLAEDEIFVRYPGYASYYISSYGRALSTKSKVVSLMNGAISPQGYLIYSFSKEKQSDDKPRGNEKPISASRAVADVFLPNFWTELRYNQLQAHHLDHNKQNNYYKNLLLVPATLHSYMNRVWSVVLYEKKRYRKRTPLEIHEITGLSLDEIILAMTAEPVDENGSYTVYQVGIDRIGFKLTKKRKRKNRSKRKSKSTKK